MAFKGVVTDTVTSFNQPVVFAEQSYPAHAITTDNFVNWNSASTGIVRALQDNQRPIRHRTP